MKIPAVYTLNSHLLNTKTDRMFLSFEATATNSVDPDQTAPVGAV